MKICQNELNLAKDYFENKESSGRLANEDEGLDSLLGIPPANEDQQHGNELSTYFSNFNPSETNESNISHFSRSTVSVHCLYRNSLAILILLL